MGFSPVTNKKHTYHMAGSLLALSFALSAFPVSAMANDDLAVAETHADSAVANSTAEPENRNEIIVTGRNDGYIALESLTGTKTNTPLLDVPQTVSVMTREEIDDQAFQDIGDILRYTPGASIGQGEGHRDQMTIRGQSSTADFFVDGLRDDVQYFRPLYNLERVEVLKGSNALIFGRGGGGGVVNRVTKTPVENDLFGEASASLDTFGSWNISGDVNISVAENAAFRVNAFYEELDNHRDFYNGERFAINPTFGVVLGEKTRLVASYEYVDDDRVVDRGVPSYQGAPLRGYRDTFFGSKDQNVTTLEAHIAQLRLEHEFSDAFQFHGTVKYADYDKLYQNIYPVGIDLAANTVKVDGYSDTTERENFFAQANLVWNGNTGSIGHTILFGAEYGHQNSDNARRDAYFDDSMDDQITFAFSDPIVLPSFGFPAFVRDRSSTVDVFSLYIQDQIAINEHFDIVAGVRYDNFEIDTVNNFNNAPLSSTDNKWSPRAGLIYKPQEHISLYASYSQSFLPRSGDQFLSLTATTANLAPEKFENYEIGGKWDIRPDLRLTAAYFWLNRDNAVTPDPVNPDNSFVTESKTHGLELQLTGRILPFWQINAGYSFLDGQQRDKNLLSDAQLSEQQLSQVPEHMFSIWNKFDVYKGLSWGLGVTYQDNQYASFSNNVTLPDYTRFDLAIFYDITDNIAAQVNIENLFDETYYPSAHNDNNISTGEPFNARFTITARF